MGFFSTGTKTRLQILFTFVLALALMSLHVPSLVKWIYPQWLIIVVLYWAFATPHLVNVGVACMIGFLLDFMYNAPVGENAVALITATYFIIFFSKQIKLFIFWKKVAAIFGLMIWCKLLPLLLQICLDKYFISWSALGQAVASTLVWLFIEWWFNYKRRSYFEIYY